MISFNIRSAEGLRLKSGPSRGQHLRPLAAAAVRSCGLHCFGSELGQAGQRWRRTESPGNSFMQPCYCRLYRRRQEKISGKLASLYGTFFLREDMEITAEGEAEERR